MSLKKKKGIVHILGVQPSKKKKKGIVHMLRVRGPKKKERQKEHTIILCRENHKESTKKLLKLIKFSKIAVYKISIQKNQLYFLYTSNENVMVKLRKQLYL